jgi:hypothetical protein
MMTTRYQSLWREVDYLRDHPKLFEQLLIELQHELEREAKEALRVHCPAFERDCRVVWEDA